MPFSKKQGKEDQGDAQISNSQSQRFHLVVPEKTQIPKSAGDSAGKSAGKKGIAGRTAGSNAGRPLLWKGRETTLLPAVPPAVPFFPALFPALSPALLGIWAFSVLYHAAVIPTLRIFRGCFDLEGNFHSLAWPRCNEHGVI